MDLRTLFRWLVIGGFCFSSILVQAQTPDWLTAEKQTALKIQSNPAISENIEEIRNLISLAVNGSFEESWNASIQLAAMGDVVLPYLLPFLADEREDLHRTQVIVVLKKLGSQAVLPLVLALETDDYFLQQNICIVLREIRDARSLGYLRWLTENPNGFSEVLPYAEQAIKAIGGPADKAKQTLYNQGMWYYKQVPTNDAFTPHNVWRYDAEKKNVAFVTVPESAYFASLAEEVCQQALKIDPTDRSVWALLVCAYFKQYVETRNLSTKVEGVELSEETKKAYAQTEKLFVKKKMFGNSAGVDALMAGLNLAIDNNNPEVGVEILDALGEVCNEQDLVSGNPVFKALTSSHQMLRYASARALIRINPTRAFPGSERVIPNMAEACNNKEVALHASETLASLDPSRSIFNAGSAVGGLVPLLSSQTKEIKMSTIRALGQIGNAGALASLAKILTSKSEDSSIRSDAAWAIGEIFKISGSIEPQAYEALIQGVRDSNPEVRNQSGLAMGKAAKLDPAKRFSLFLAEREGGTTSGTEESGTEESGKEESGTEEESGKEESGTEEESGKEESEEGSSEEMEDE